MYFLLNHIPDLVVTLIGIALQWVAAVLILRNMEATRRDRLTRPVFLVALVLSFLLVFALALQAYRVAQFFPPRFTTWTKALAIVWLIGSAVALTVRLILMWLPEGRDFSPGRRRMLLAARGAVLASPVVATGYGVFIQRSDLRTKEVKISIPGLPRELDDTRLVQLSDIHLSPFLTVRELERAVDMANEARADVALITGDMITSAADPLDTCLDRLKRVRATYGVIGCLGNHEIYADAQDYATTEAARMGMDFLRSRSRVVALKGSALNFAGVDYQRMHREYLRGAERLVRPDMVNILLSHNPDVFPVAASQGYQLTIAGHTHGGQITVEILSQNLSIARFYTPYVYGLYRQGNAAVYVTRGIGTVGVPARLGAPPEVALIRLCAT
jgi:uncharacterized protein